MTPDFWQKAWKNSQTDFSQKTPNPKLIKYFKALNTPKDGRFFVPLCGKSVDMLWFIDQGFDVVGVELSKIAVRQFFTENNLQATILPHPTNPRLASYQAKIHERLLNIWVGDIFELSAIDVGQIDAIYDRGALVALPDSTPDYLRSKYTQQLIAISCCANQLVISFSYDGKSQRGSNYKNLPPFLVTRTQLEGYYAKDYQITLVAKEQVDYVSTAGDSGYRLVYTLIKKQLKPRLNM